MTTYINATTQDHLDIEDIKEDLVILRNGSVCAVLSTTAVNFDLKSEIEQDAIIASFSMLLNSLTFPVQIVLRSKKLDITKYLEKIKRTEDKLIDPLLKQQAQAYRKFVQDFIKTNEVLDKKFYVVIPSGGNTEFELGSSPFEFVTKLFGFHTRRVRVDVATVLADAKTRLMPRVDHMVNELNRLSVRSRMMTTQELVELYFDIYNPSSVHGQRIRTNIEDYKTAIVNPAILEE